jgi:D-alanyl-D-alanine carboxypeptidase
MTTPATPDSPTPRSSAPASPAPGSSAAVPDEATLEALDRWLDYRLWHSRTPGAQVAVGVAGRPYFSRAYGYADLERSVPMRTDHLFRIASHSKTFTATLVLQLVEAGRLGLDDPIGTHLPALAEGPLAGIGVRELMEHTGGVLRDGLESRHWELRRDFPDVAELLEMARVGGVKTAPGERFAYSNIGYSLLGLVVEAVTGQSFGDAARAQIVAPLGLTDTDPDYLHDRAEDYATGYSGLHTAGRRRPLGHIDTHAMAAATGFTSTATDMLTYFGAHAFGDERLLSDRTKRVQQRRANGSDPAKSDAAGYGWGMIVEQVDDQTYVGHSGGYPGHITKTLLDPTTGLVISVLTNAIDGPAASLARGVVQLLADARRTTGQAGPSDSARSRTGRYRGEWGVTDIAVVGGRLLALDPTAWAPVESVDELAEEGDGFRIATGSGFGSVGEPVTFAGGDGEPLVMDYAGMSMTAFPDLPGGPAQRSGLRAEDAGPVAPETP